MSPDAAPRRRPPGPSIPAPDDDADAEGGERDAEGGALDLGLATGDVDDEERKTSERGEPEQSDDDPFRARPTADHSRLRRRSIQRVMPTRPTRYTSQPT